MVPVHLVSSAMGGRLVLRAMADPDRALDAPHDLEMVARRVRAWAAILTRHADDSALLRLDRDPRATVPVGPTLAAALAWAADAADLTGGIVDVTLLDERLAAEGIRGRTVATHAPAAPWSAAHEQTAPGPAIHDGPTALPAGASWSIRGGQRHRGAVVTRRPGARFDLDGVGKGWIADRALALLDRHPGALVDADGDIAIRPARGERVSVGVADPRDPSAQLAVLSLAAGPGRRTWGVATSGISVHRWATAAGTTHHLIDPRTGRSAATDVVQATVVAATAREAEALAKTAVILGAVDGLRFLDRTATAGAVLLLGDGRVVALPRTMELVA